MRSRRYTTRPRATNETPDLAANVATKEEILGMALLPEAHGAMRDESKPDTSFGSGSEKRKRLKEKGGGGGCICCSQAHNRTFKANKTKG